MTLHFQGKNAHVDVFGSSLRITRHGLPVTVVLDHPVREVLAVDEVLVVRVEPQPGMTLNENVFGLSSSGTRLWQIAKAAHVYADSPYTKVSRGADGAIWAHNWDGASCRIDPRNGTILEVRIGK